MNRLTGADVANALMLLSVDLGDAEPTSEQIDVRLAMMARGEDAMDTTRADALLNAPAPEYLRHIAPLLDMVKDRPAIQEDVEAQVSTVALSHPLDDVTQVEVRPLTGKDYRLALSDYQSVPRIAAMTGLTIDQVKRLDIADWRAIGDATAPFVLSVWEALLPGGDSWQASSDTALTSPE